MEDPELRTNYSPPITLIYLPCTAESIVKVLEDDPDHEFSAYGVAEKLGSTRIQYIRTVLNRKAGFGKGSGPVKKTARGLYQFCKDKKEPLLDQFRQSGSFGIENLVFSKKENGHDILGDTLPNYAPDPKGENITITHQVSNMHQLRTKKNGKEWAPRHGFPWQLRTGQEVGWWIYPTGTEMVVFNANGSSHFSIDLILYILDSLKGFGLGPGWERVSMEWNIDNKRFTVSEPVSFQVAEKEMLKFYQHGNTARLEGVDKRRLTFEDSMIVMVEAYERSEGRQALKRVNAMETVIENVMGEMKRQGNYLRSLSDRVHRMTGRQERLTGNKEVK